MKSYAQITRESIICLAMLNCMSGATGVDRAGQGGPEGLSGERGGGLDARRPVGGLHRPPGYIRFLAAVRARVKAQRGGKYEVVDAEDPVVAYARSKPDVGAIEYSLRETGDDDDLGHSVVCSAALTVVRIGMIVTLSEQAEAIYANQSNDSRLRFEALRAVAAVSNNPVNVLGPALVSDGSLDLRRRVLGELWLGEPGAVGVYVRAALLKESDPALKRRLEIAAKAFEHPGVCTLVRDDPLILGRDDWRGCSYACPGPAGARFVRTDGGCADEVALPAVQTWSGKPLFHEE